MFMGLRPLVLYLLLTALLLQGEQCLMGLRPLVLYLLLTALLLQGEQCLMGLRPLVLYLLLAALLLQGEQCLMGLRLLVLYLLLAALLLQGEQCLIRLRPLVLYYFAFGSASTIVSTRESDVLCFSAHCPASSGRAMLNGVETLSALLFRFWICFDNRIDQKERCALLFCSLPCFFRKNNA
ncbi:hypothetical protein K469DRAFT_61246 [Zopfia rhizophila CBS 207.26]|uniref:Uncharacterized protein n=1 Tax=Zopfia rhizophila CBS 207.26 TaxID=1314779 RepID=A0A6A6EF37_9PEZI|nr:hypothetical protein K469DRAFT_61246 [Zopfia rhizophila CBS 207.26]